MNPKLVAQWMQGLRRLAPYIQDDPRVFDCFYESQLVSKMAILNALENYKLDLRGSVHIIGGWYGILGSMLLDKFSQISTVYSWDLDPNCKFIGRHLEPSEKLRFITCDMEYISQNEYFVLPEYPKLIINTSTEHVTQDVFDSWLKGVPDTVPIILQGNDYFDCKEHVRCSHNMDEFKQQNPLNRVLDEDVIRADNFNRFMTFGYK
jgi:hypothetical protein